MSTIRADKIKTEQQRINQNNKMAGYKLERKVESYLGEFGFKRILCSGSRNLADVENDDYLVECKMISPKGDPPYVLFKKSFIPKHIERADKQGKIPMWVVKMRDYRIKEYYVILRGEDFTFNNAFTEPHSWQNNEKSWKIYRNDLVGSGLQHCAYKIRKMVCELGTFYMMDMRLFKALLNYQYNNVPLDSTDIVHITTGTYSGVGMNEKAKGGFMDNGN